MAKHMQGNYLHKGYLLIVILFDSSFLYISWNYIQEAEGEEG